MGTAVASAVVNDFDLINQKHPNSTITEQKEVQQVLEDEPKIEPPSDEASTNADETQIKVEEAEKERVVEEEEKVVEEKVERRRSASALRFRFFNQLGSMLMPRSRKR